MMLLAIAAFCSTSYFIEVRILLLVLVQIRTNIIDPIACVLSTSWYRARGRTARCRTCAGAAGRSCVALRAPAVNAAGAIALAATAQLEATGARSSRRTWRRCCARCCRARRPRTHSRRRRSRSPRTASARQPSPPPATTSTRLTSSRANSDTFPSSTSRTPDCWARDWDQKSHTCQDLLNTLNIHILFLFTIMNDYEFLV